MACARCEELQEEVAYLRSELRLDLAAQDRVALRVVFDLATGAASILAALYAARGRTVSQMALEEALPTENDSRACRIVNVYVSRIRSRLGRDAIHTVWGEGYSLTPTGQARVAAALSTKAAA